jgi:hypothetical protein
MTTEPETPRSPSGERRGTVAGRFGRLLLRILFVLVVGTCLGLAAYFGGPALYRNYIEPVQVNTQRIADLEQALAQMQARDQQDQTNSADHLAQIEGRLAAQAETLATLQADVEGLQSSQAGHDQHLQTLDELSTRVDALAGDMEQMATQVAGLETSLAGGDSPTQRLGRQLQLIRVMELLTRARLWLIQNNVGLAADEVRSARAVLEQTAAEAPEAEAATLTPILERLDLALTDLQFAPIVAADDLEIAWRLLFSATAP